MPNRRDQLNSAATPADPPIVVKRDEQGRVVQAIEPLLRYLQSKSYSVNGIPIVPGPFGPAEGLDLPVG